MLIGAESLEMKLCYQNEGGSDEKLEPIEARVFMSETTYFRETE